MSVRGRVGRAGEEKARPEPLSSIRDCCNTTKENVLSGARCLSPLFTSEVGMLCHSRASKLIYSILPLLVSRVRYGFDFRGR